MFHQWQSYSRILLGLHFKTYQSVLLRKTRVQSTFHFHNSLNFVTEFSTPIYVDILLKCISHDEIFLMGWKCRLLFVTNFEWDFQNTDTYGHCCSLFSELLFVYLWNAPNSFQQLCSQLSADSDFNQTSGRLNTKGFGLTALWTRLPTNHLKCDFNNIVEMAITSLTYLERFIAKVVKNSSTERKFHSDAEGFWLLFIKQQAIQG